MDQLDAVWHCQCLVSILVFVELALDVAGIHDPTSDSLVSILVFVELALDG